MCGRGERGVASLSTTRQRDISGKARRQRREMVNNGGMAHAETMTRLGAGQRGAK